MSVGVAVAITAGAVAVAWTVVLIGRRFAPESGLMGTPEPNHTGSALSVLGTGFAILTAFVLLLSFQSFLNAKRNADTEARATQEMYLLTDYFPSAQRDELEGELVCYARAVIHDEWPRMRHQRRSEVVERWDVSLGRHIHSVPVRNVREASEYSEWFDQRSLRTEGRHERLQEAAPFVPPLLWVALITAAVILVLYVCMFANPRMRLPLQLAVVAAITIVASLNLSVVRFLDAPYSGTAGSIKPTAMKDALRTMEADLAPSTAVPCNRRGRPF